MLPLCCSVYSLPSSKSMPASPPSPQALTPREDPLIPGPLALCLSCSLERSRLRSWAYEYGCVHHDFHLIQHGGTNATGAWASVLSAPSAGWHVGAVSSQRARP